MNQQQIEAGLGVIRAVADSIRELREVPAGHLYARLMTHGITLSGFESIVRILVNGGLVRKQGDLLIWAELDNVRVCHASV